MRPLGVAALEDKIVQAAVVEILDAIYETDFLGFSYGFRPGRGAHDALNALAVGIHRQRVNWVLDADIRGFFDNHCWPIYISITSWVSGGFDSCFLYHLKNCSRLFILVGERINRYIFKVALFIWNRSAYWNVQ